MSVPGNQWIYANPSVNWSQSNELGTGGWSMPDRTLLMKLEETDPSILRDNSDVSYHDDFMRKEIVDRTLDDPFTEADEKRTSRPNVERLNILYHGNRSNQTEFGGHPELFYGFTGNDPRGVVNDPRFNDMRQFMTGKGIELAVRMGKNDDGQIAERPWTGPSLSYARKIIMDRTRKALRVFDVAKVNFIPGQNASLKKPGENPAYEIVRDQEGSYLDRESTEMSNNIRHDVTYRNDIWKHARHDADMKVADYGILSQGGLKPGRGNAHSGTTDQDAPESVLMSTRSSSVISASRALASKVAAMRRNGASEEEITISVDTALKAEAFVRALSVPKGDQILMKSMGDVDPAILQGVTTMMETMMKNSARLTRAPGAAIPFEYEPNLAILSGQETMRYNHGELRRINPYASQADVNGSSYEGKNRAHMAPAQRRHDTRVVDGHAEFVESLAMKNVRHDKKTFQKGARTQTDYMNSFGGNEEDFRTTSGAIGGKNLRADHHNDFSTEEWLDQ